ncbi:hypothetical protein ACOSP7_004445 [Xanthoceras sorbifolium]
MDGNQNAPSPTTSKDPSHHEGLVSQLTETVKGLVNQAVAELKQKSQAFIVTQTKNNEEVVEAMPISYHVPDDCNSNNVYLSEQAIAELKQKSEAFVEPQTTNNEQVVEAMPISYHVPDDCNSNNLSLSEKKIRQKTKLVGEIETSFEIPEEYASHGIELDKLHLLPHLQERIKPDLERGVQLKFVERLKEWKLQCKQRADGKLDTYFHHSKSNEHFRSNVEVVNFILYARYPRHLKKAAKAPKEEILGSNGDRGLPKSYDTSSCSPDRGKSDKKHCTTRISRDEENAVQEFLEMAYNNMMNSHSFMKHDDKPRNYRRVSSASSKGTADDSFHLENTYGIKRRKTETSSSATSRTVEKCRAPSLDTVTAPSVDAVSNVNVEVQDKMMSVPEPNTILEPINRAANI